ncbi:hypothetical protein DJ568_08905 [Mucilaginibacter hurinus]|uniref:Uncharacterized protein n=1 Tax=Mucilaginibacter hurinus TaxID=2201324 RepID=A0A367GP75_9SPHI|nr:hypothetical protein [Mucilaginibacter hurinus]RCH55292.1 hypothetical protein DJ568_08905 [Mucilaginibacter hurinus]
MAGISVWAAGAAAKLADGGSPIYTREIQGFIFAVHHTDDILWIVATWPGGARTSFRTAYAPDNLTVNKITESAEGVRLDIASNVGAFTVAIDFPQTGNPVLHYTVQLWPGLDMFIPFWPRDVIMTPANGNIGGSAGDIHISQIGTRSGLVYASFARPKAGTLLYFQNLTALADYHSDTQTSAADNVGGQWPEIGLSLPAAIEKPLLAGKTYTISDAWITFSNDTPADQFDIAKGYLNALSQIYMLIPKPEPKYHDYPDVLNKALYDLQNNKGCWTYHNGHPYLNAYVCDYYTPPEIMVQLAVLLPVQDYMRWSGERCVIEQDIINALPAFFNEKLGTVMRWLPAQEDMLDKSEEQKVPKVMDSWYLHHPLLNLARVARAGNKIAKELLLKSVDYAIKVAHHFNYKWPVFYQMETLEVIKAETKEGEGGEKDVAALYAHVMLQVWEITKEKRYLNEAEKAARSLVQHGFNIFYQANNTMFGAKAMLLLYKYTKKEFYLNLCYLLIANVFKNVSLWECRYGYGPNFPNFFSVFPLNDAPYTAVYEEQEVFAGVHELLANTHGVDFMPSAAMLLAEFVRHTVHRAVYYYPTLLPEDMLAEKIKTGELDPKLWVALEDIHDGWEKSGEVGQEVYGAGLAFGIVPRQYIKIPDHDFLIFVDYPVSTPQIKNKTISFNTLGVKELNCRMCIVKTGKSKLPRFKVMTGSADDQLRIDSNKAKKDRHEYLLHGDQKVIISWS